MTELLAKIYAMTELESIKRDAESSEGRTAEERVAMILDLMNTVEAIRGNLTPEERERQLRIGDLLNARPNPWWRNFRKEALDEYECQSDRMSATKSELQAFLAEYHRRELTE